MLRLKRPLRPSSNVDPEDTLAAKLHLADLGYYAPPTGEFHGWPDAEMFAGLTEFQTAAGETPDGEMLPGGPTEAALNRLAAARPPIPAEKPNDYQRALAKGLVREEDAASDSESWGESTRRQTGMQPTPTFAAAVPAIAGSLLEATGITAGGALTGAALYALQRGLKGDDAEHPESRSLMEAEGWHRAALPPEKPAPPRDFDPVEAQKIQQELMRPPEAPPSIEMEPEQILPPEFDPMDWVEVFPNQSEEFPQILILEKRRGTPPIRDHLRTVVSGSEKAALKAGSSAAHEAGSRNAKGNEIPEKYVRGRHTGNTKDASYFDSSFYDPTTRRWLHVETYTANANYAPDTRERNQQAKALINKETGDIIVAFPKPPAGFTVSEEKVTELMEPFFRELGRKHDPKAEIETSRIHILKPEFIMK